MAERFLQALDSSYDENKNRGILDVHKLLEGRLCGPEAKPHWRIREFDHNTGMEVATYWLRPAEDDDFIARRAVQMLNSLGCFAEAQMTEWHPKKIDAPKSGDAPGNHG